MTNKDFARLFKMTASLMELHDENPFKVRAFTGAVFAIEKMSAELITLSPEELEKVDGLGKGIVAKIGEIKVKGTFADLDLLLSQTPEGVTQMLKIKGIGPKKVRSIWKDAGIESIDLLSRACEENKIALLKGFGEKTQQTILENIVFLLQQKGRFFYAEAEPIAQELQAQLQAGGYTFSLSGEVRRFMETVECVKFLVATESAISLYGFLDKLAILEKLPKECSPFAWRGLFPATGIKVEVKVCPPEEFGSKLILDSSGQGHLERGVGEGQSLFTYLKKNRFATEEKAYGSLGLPTFLPELREGLFEFEWAEKDPTLNSYCTHLISFADIQGTLHNHTNYSDGEHTLAQMAQKCIDMGLSYFGVADHSKSAQYASGLYEEKVLKQQKEIDEINKSLIPFKIFKGIESDILSDGRLDYEDHILQTFDYVVASIHSSLKMDEARATARIIKAVENPYTTILGHPTGRLLLRRQGYPLDHQKIIDACVANGVCIEINASPYRLDLDWRWIPYAMEKGAMLSINPDAHEMEGLNDMYYGVCVARKGGLTKQACLNAKPLEEVAAFFAKKK